MPMRVRWMTSHKRDADHDRRGEHDEAKERIGHRHGVAVGTEGEHDRGDHRAVEPFGDGELVGLAGPHREHEVGGDDGDADRHQRLAQIVALHAAEDEDLHQGADGRRREEAGGDAEEPQAGPARHLEADIGAEEIERAMRQIDVAHQPEDEGEAAGDEEIEAGERDAVEDGGDEQLFRADERDQPVRPDGEEQPEQERGEERQEEDWERGFHGSCRRQAELRRPHRDLSRSAGRPLSPALSPRGERVAPGRELSALDSGRANHRQCDHAGGKRNPLPSGERVG